MGSARLVSRSPEINGLAALRRQGYGLFPARISFKSQPCHNPVAGLRYSSEYHYSGVNSMDMAVSAADANRRFSELLRTVKKGGSVVVTSHGKPVARITPVVEGERDAEAARSALFARLRTERAVKAGPWTRDELYDDAP